MPAAPRRDRLHRRHGVRAAGPPGRDDPRLTGTHYHALLQPLCWTCTRASSLQTGGRASEACQGSLHPAAASWHVGCMQVTATLRVDAVPALPGAEEVLAEGIASSLAPSNAAAASAAVRDSAAAGQHARWPLLLDPQTGVVPCSGFPACLHRPGAMCRLETCRWLLQPLCIGYRREGSC